MLTSLLPKTHALSFLLSPPITHHPRPTSLSLPLSPTSNSKNNRPLHTSNLLLMVRRISISKHNILSRWHSTRNLNLLHNLLISLLNRTFQINCSYDITELVLFFDESDVAEFYLDEELGACGDVF
jgi:hypothetical protein